MTNLSSNTLIMAVQAVAAAIARITEPVAGDYTRLDADDQELLVAYSLAEEELKAAYLAARERSPALPAYEDLVREP